jgi:micrococcal nuclease
MNPFGKLMVVLGAASTLTIGATVDTHLPGPVPARVVEVIDGDSLRVRALIWIGQELETVVRLSGVDAPELKGKCPWEREAALRARDQLAVLVNGGEVRLRDVRFDKYGGRVVASVETARGEDVARRLLAERVVRRYEGSARAGWCDETARAGVRG